MASERCSTYSSSGGAGPGAREAKKASAQKPLEWLTSLLGRFEEQLPVKAGPCSASARLLVQHSQACLVSVAKQKRTLVVTGLVRMLASVNSTKVCSENDLFESQCIILDTLQQCLAESAATETRASATRLEEVNVVKVVLGEMWSQFLQLPSDSNQTVQLKERAGKVLYALSTAHSSAVFSRVSARLKLLGSDSAAQIPSAHGSVVDCGADVELIRHMHVDGPGLINLLNEVAFHRPFRRPVDQVGGLALALEKAVWNWMDSYPQLYAELKHDQEGTSELTISLTAVCERIFEHLDEVTSEQAKKKPLLWPLSMMTLILCPRTLEMIYHGSAGAPMPQRAAKKQEFFEAVKRYLSQGWQATQQGMGVGSLSSKQQSLVTAAAVAAVKLLKGATYVSVNEFFANVYFSLLQSLVEDAKPLLFNASKPLFRHCGPAELEVLIDAFVALFRLKADVDAFRVCLARPHGHPAPNAPCPPPYNLILIISLYRIAIQPRLPWWPKIELVFSRSPELRALFNDTLTKVSQSATSQMPAQVSALAAGQSQHVPLTVSRSIPSIVRGRMGMGGRGERSGSGTSVASFAPGQGPAEEAGGSKLLLFWLIRLMCTEPTLFLHERKQRSPGPEGLGQGLGQGLGPPGGPVGGAGEAEGRVEVTGDASHNSTSELISGLVILMSQASHMTDIAQESMEALLCLHRPDNIRLWNPESSITAMTTFWYISSQLIFSVSQKLLHHQLANYPEVLRWLRQVLLQRNAYLLLNREIANIGTGEQLCRQAAVKLETVCFVYLWSADNDAVVTAMSLFRALCEEAEIRCDDPLPPEYPAHAELARDLPALPSVGRLALQKSVGARLRRLPAHTPASTLAWEETAQHWDKLTAFLRAYPRSRSEDGFASVHNLHRVLTQANRLRTSHDHHFDEMVAIWANMTGFLCSLGGVCSHTSPPATQCQSVRSSMVLLNVRPTPVAVGGMCQDQYCPVTLFISRLLSLLMSERGEPLDPTLVRHLKELMAYELNPALYPTLFEQIKTYTGRFFDSSGHVILNSQNSEFLEHIVYVMKVILSEKGRRLGPIVIEPILLSICKYIRYLDFSPRTLTVKAKICSLIEMIMARREEVVLRAEIRFRNRLVEHVTDWLMEQHPAGGAAAGAGGSAQALPHHSHSLQEHIRNVDCLCMSAVGALLAGLPLQPEESERDVLDAKSQLFQKYFQLFMNLLNDCLQERGSGVGSGSLGPMPSGTLPRDLAATNSTIAPELGSGTESETGSLKGDLATPEVSMASVGTAAAFPSFLLSSTHHFPHASAAKNEKLLRERFRELIVAGMSSLLAANIDCGLVHAIGLGYHHDMRVRSAFIEVLTKILQQGLELETLNETVMADRHEELLRLVTMISDDGELPVALALAHSVQTHQLDELARTLVTSFDAKHLLYELCWKVLSKEVELAEAPTTLFRGNTLASKIMGFCFRIYGASYLHNLLKDFIQEMDGASSYEVDPGRLEAGEELGENVGRVLRMAKRAFDAVVRSYARFPAQLRSLAHCIYQVVNGRFPGHGLPAVEIIVFLRFINPAIVSPFEHGLLDSPPTPRLKRGLTLVSKILQAIANQATFLREVSLQPFNIFIQSRQEHARKFITNVTLGPEAAEGGAAAVAAASGVPGQAPSWVQGGMTSSGTQGISFVSEGQVCALHRLLWSHSDEIGELLSTQGTQASLLSRRLATLLAQIGPPSHAPAHSAHSWTRAVELTRGAQGWEEYMTEVGMGERDEYKSIQSLNIFYPAGQSKQGHPLYCYIARRYRLGEVDGDALIYHVLMTLKPHQQKGRPFQLIMDMTHSSNENRFRTDILQRWFLVMPELVLENLQTAFVYNANTWLKEYVHYHHRLMGPLRSQRKVVLVEALERLCEEVDGDQHRLPAATLALDADLKVFPNALKLWHKDLKVTVKVAPTALQIQTMDRVKLLGQSVRLNDVYYASEIEEVCLVDDNNVTLNISNEPHPLSIIHNDCEQMVTAIVHIRTRHELGQGESGSWRAAIRAKDVPGTLLNMALLNLGSGEASLRTAAYNLLCALAHTFDFHMHQDELLETAGLLIPANNTIFINEISARLAANEPHLTLEFLEECIQGFRQSSNELKHLCLEYMEPWLAHLPRFIKQPGEEGKRQKVVQIIERLITLTVEEPEMYPLFQCKVWAKIGSVVELLDMVLDGFIRRSQLGGLGSPQAELMADTAVALGSGNVAFVARNIVNRLIGLLDRSSANPAASLDENGLWDDIAILARYLLMLSFNNCLDVRAHLPYLFHFVTVLVNTGPLALRASIHGLVINIIHSLSTSSRPSFSEETKRTLKSSLTQFSLPKFYALFGISELSVKTVGAAAFQLQPPGRLSPGLSTSMASLLGTVVPGGSASRADELTLPQLETVTEALMEILQACQAEMEGRELVAEWSEVARSFAFRYNPALQPRGLVVFACLASSATDQDLHHLLAMLLQAVKRRENMGLISALLMAIARLHTLLPQNSPLCKSLFWVSVVIFQMEDADLYGDAVHLMHENLRCLDAQGVFRQESLERVMMATRAMMDWEFKALDQQAGLSFRSEFHFALVGYLLKGLRSDAAPKVQTGTVRLLGLLLTVVARPERRPRFEVRPDSLPYLLALLPFSEEVQRRCHLHPATLTTLSISGSAETLTAQRLDGPSVDWAPPLGLAPLAQPDDHLDPPNPDLLNQADPQGPDQRVVPTPPVELDSVLGGVGLGHGKHEAAASVQIPQRSQLRPSWRMESVEQAGPSSKAQPRRARAEGGQAQGPPAQGAQAGPSHRALERTRSLPVNNPLPPPPPDIPPPPEELGPSPPDPAPSGPPPLQVDTSHSAYQAGPSSGTAPRISVSEDEPSTGLSGGSSAGEGTLVSQRSGAGGGGGGAGGRPMSRLERASVQEANVLLDPQLLSDERSQVLVLAILAILVRNTAGESEWRVLFEYLAEASNLFPQTFPIVHPLIDQRLTQVVQLWQEPGLVRAVLHIVANMVPEGGAAEPVSAPSLHHLGFGGLWRYAGPFLNKCQQTAAFGAMSGDMCLCLERLLCSVGEPPATPPAPSPRLPTSPVFADFPSPNPSHRQNPP